jgi:heme oxygenase
LDEKSLLAHLYTWHMGDMYGGQMIKKILPGSHSNLEFENAEELKTNLRAKLDDSLGNEANKAFEWAIKIMDTYNNELSMEHAD